MTPKQRKNNGYSVVNRYTRKECCTGTHFYYEGQRRSQGFSSYRPPEAREETVR